MNISADANYSLGDTTDSTGIGTASLEIPSGINVYSNSVDFIYDNIITLTSTQTATFKFSTKTINNR